MHQCTCHKSSSSKKRYQMRRNKSERKHSQLGDQQNLMLYFPYWDWLHINEITTHSAGQSSPTQDTTLSNNLPNSPWKREANGPEGGRIKKRVWEERTHKSMPFEYRGFLSLVGALSLGFSWTAEGRIPWKFRPWTRNRTQKRESAAKGETFCGGFGRRTERLLSKREVLCSALV